MEKTQVVLDPAYKIAKVDPRIFGGFLEHIGRAVYQGIYDPASSHADENGFRQDVLGALRRLRLTAMRYPGGNFASLCFDEWNVWCRTMNPEHTNARVSDQPQLGRSRPCDN